MKEYYLVTDATAEEVKRLTGMKARDTPLGALVEKPRPFDLDAAMAQFDRARRGPPCCTGGVMHAPWCKYWGVTT